MTVHELAAAVAALLREGRFADVQRDHWADDILVVEPMDGPMARLQGKEAIAPKLAWWNANHEVHGCEVDGPYVHLEHFALKLTLDVTPAGGTRHTLREIVTYRVRDGKIAEELYFFGV